MTILRQRVSEELRRPGPGGEPRFSSDTQFARFLGVDRSHVSRFLHPKRGDRPRGFSFETLDRLADLLDVPLWRLFWTPEVPIDGPRMKKELL